MFYPWVRKIPWRRKWQPTPVFFREKVPGQRSWWATVHRVARVEHNWASAHTCTQGNTVLDLEEFTI